MCKTFFQPDSKKPPLINTQAGKAISSEVLFATHNEVIIEHQAEQYRLRRTRNGKLILTK